MPENLAAFQKKFETVVSNTIDPQLLIPEIIVDTLVDFSEINRSFYNILCQMEPFGPENMRPVFIARAVVETGYSKIAKEQHIRFAIKQGNTVMNGIGFNMAEKYPLLQMKKPLDIVFALDENEWNGNVSLQLKVIDIRLSEQAEV